MKPPRYTGTPIGGDNKIEGELVTESGRYYIKTPGTCVKSSTDPLVNTNFVKFYGIRVVPATVEPVRLPVAAIGDEGSQSFYCPECEDWLRAYKRSGRYYEAQSYCDACGQALEWPEDKEG